MLLLPVQMKDASGCPAAPEEFPFTALLALFLFVAFSLCLCVCVCVRMAPSLNDNHDCFMIVA